MKKLLICCWLAVALCACHSHDEKESETVYDETIIIYMPWTENLTTDLQKNVSDMKQAITTAGGTGSKRIIVFFAENESKAALYEIKYERGACRNDTLQRYTFPETNYTTAEGLASILREGTGQYALLLHDYRLSWHGMDACRRQAESK